MKARFFSFFLLLSLAPFAWALSYPTVAPPGEMTWGTYRNYFDNIFANYGSDCDTYGQVIWWFTSTGVPICVSPVSSGLFLSGQTAGDTIRFNGTDWVRTNLIYNNATNVGIGMQSPSYLLDVAGTGNFLWIRLPTGAASGNVLISDASGNAYWAASFSGTYSASGITWGTQDYLTKFWTSGNGLTLSQIFDNGTSIGIGTATPSATVKLDIIGDILLNSLRLGRGPGNTISNTVFGWNALWVNVSGTTDTAIWYGALSALTSGDGNIGIGNLAWSTFISGNNNIFIGNNTQPNISTAGSNQLNIGNWIYGNAGNIGIGAANPGAKLEVNGQIKITGGWPGSGYVLVSDSSGLATWQAWVPASTVDATNITNGVANYIPKFGTGWTGIFASTLYQSAGYIGIANTNPSVELDVNGRIRMRTWAWSGLVLLSDGSGTASWWTVTASTVSASGVINGTQWYLPYFTTGGNGLISSLLFQTGSFIGINSTSPAYTLQVNGTGSFSGFRLPTGSSNGYILTSDASGNASWQAAAAWVNGWQTNYIARWLSATTLWTWSLSDNGTNVGIWVPTASYKLEVAGTGSFSGFRLPTGSANGRLLMSDALWNASWTGFIVANSLSITGSVLWYTLYYDGTNWIPSANIYHTGSNVGIGTATPGAKLEVNGQVKITGGSPGLNKILTSDAVGLASWSNVFSGNTLATGITWGASGYLSLFWSSGNWLYSSLLFQTWSFIGINSTSPVYTLQVNGTGSFSGFRLPTGSSNGYILTSDASGNASWTAWFSWSTSASWITWWTQNYLAKFGTGWNGIYISQIYDTGTWVGIGTASPGASLEVNGQVKITGGSPGLNKVLISDATGLASWINPTSSLSWSFWTLSGNTASTSDFLGTTNNQDLRFYTNNTQKMVLTSAWRLGIGVVSPTTASLEVSWATLISGDLTVQGKVITDTIISRTVTNVTVSGSILPDINAPLTYRDIGTNTGRWNNLYLSGQVTIGWGSPGLNKILTSDAVGLASWSNVFSGNTLATGITWGASGYLSLFWSSGNWLYSSLLFQTWSFIGINSTSPVYTLQVNGTGSFSGFRLPTGSAAWRYLVSDASGNASWTGLVTATSLSITWAVTWSTLYYNGLSWNAGTWLFNTWGNIGIGTITPGAKLELNSWSGNTSWFKITQLTATSPVFGGVAAPLGVDGSGNVVVAQQGAIPVYTALWATPNAAVDTTTNPPTIGANYDKYFTINARQSFAVTDVWWVPYNCPEFQTGSTNKGPTGCTQTPWASYVMTAQNATSGNRYAYQILISDRVDAPFVVRWGMYSTASGTLMNTAMTVPALWFKAITVPTNRSDWFYINPWVDQNNNPISWWGNIGIGTMSPQGKLEVFTGSNSMLHFRGTDNVGMGLSALDTGVSGARNSWFGAYALDVITSGWGNTALWYMAGSNITTWSNNIMIWSWATALVATWSNQLNIGNWIYGSGGNIGINSTSPAYTLQVNGTGSFSGFRLPTGSSNGYILTSDASGNARWAAGFSWSISASWITWWTQNYVAKFGTWWNWLYSSQIFDDGTNIWIWTWSNLSTKLTIDSWIDDDSGLRLARIDPNSTLTSNAVVALWVNASGKVLPISPISNIAVYTWVLRTTVLTPDPDLNTFNITYNFNKYFGIPGKQSFVVSKGDGPAYNGPYFKENGTDALCSQTGTYTGSSFYDCATADPVTGLSASPYNSFTMTAKGDTFGYQLALGARGDAPLFARSGRFNGSQTGWLYTNDSPFQTPAPWQRVLSVPANHPEYLYINTGLNSQLQAQSWGGRVGIGTTFPQSRFEVWSGATSESFLHFRGTDNVGMGLGATNSGVSGARNSWFGAYALDVITSGWGNTALWYMAGSNITTWSNNIMIWSWATALVATWSNQLNIGNWIYGTGGYISVGNSTPASMFEVWSGSTTNSSFLHFRGTNNTALWYGAVKSNLSGNANTGIGAEALFTLSSWYSNTAIGYKALRLTLAGFNNTAVWQEALYNNNGGSWNAADGYQALYSSSSGTGNTALGAQSLYNLSTWDNNTAVGFQALRVLAGSSVRYNTALGVQALYSTTASNLTAVWYQALYSNSSGTGNLGMGYQSLYTVTTGYNNTALGYNTAVNATGNQNTIVGANAGSNLTSGSDNIIIGADTNAITATGSSQLNIGDWIYGNGGNIGIWVSNPTRKLDVGGTVKLWTAGTTITNAWVCTIASTAITTTATAYTCTGLPASTSVAIHCNAAAAFTTPNTTSLYCRPNWSANSVTCNTTVANSVATTYRCMWMQ